MDYNNKVIVVTGGSQGIGRAISMKFAELGGQVIILDVNVDGAQSVADEITALDGSAEVFKTDVSDYENVKDVFGRILDKYSKIDVLVNNAGIVDSRAFLELSEKDWNRILNINLKGVINTCHAVFPGMIEKKYGKIVNIASIAGKAGGGFFGNTIYGTSKAGVIALSKGLAREGGPFGINVNAICPGPVNTTMIAGLEGEARERILSGIPLRRFAEPEDVANVAAFLASDLARHVSGEITDVDGGLMRD